MASRPIWRGHLRVALVSCPVALHPAHHERSNLHFHFINPATGQRVRTVTQDAETEDEVSRRDLVKGYEFKKETYLVLTDEDFEAARIDSSSTLTVDKFVEAGAIDPIHYDTGYYLAPDGDAGLDVYVVLRDAIARTGRLGLSRVVIARRERAVAIRPMGSGMMVHTLHEDADLNNPDEVFADVPEARPEAEMVKLATQLIDRQTGQYDPADMVDRYEARLRDVIEAKLRGQGIEPEAPAEADTGNVIDLMGALKRSLQEHSELVEAISKPSARAAAGKTSRARPPVGKRSSRKNA